MFKKFRGTKETGSASSTNNNNNNNNNTASTGNSATATATGSAATGSSGQPRKQNTTRPPSGNVTRLVSTPTNSNSNSASNSNSNTNSSDSRRPSSRLLLNKQKSTDRKTSAASWEEANDDDKKHAQEERIEKLESAINAFLTACRTSAPLDIIDRELCALRKAILFYGIPTTPKTATEASLRGRIWNIMLAVDNVDASSYMSLIARGKCDFPTYKKIRNDSFRTFQNDNDYTSVVKEPELIRCLNSFVLECHHCTFTNESHQPQQLTFTYVQGLNTVCAPLLYCMPEVEAYAAFCKIATKLSPWYWTSSHIGVQAGCKLLDQCLEVLDPELSHHLKCHRLEAYVYAFHCVSSLSASIPPFKELVKLWDFLLAFGPHFNILCVAAQIISFRDSVLQSDNPKRVLDYRTWPRLRARYVISIAMQLLPKLPADLYHTICLHATDQATVEKVTGRRVHDVEK